MLSAALTAPGALAANGAVRAGLPDALTVGDTELPLIATGIRSKLWVDVYECGVYAGANDLGPGLARDDVTLAVRFRITTDMLPDRPPRAWRDALRGALSEQDYTHLATSFARLEPDDTLKFTFEPGRGTSVFVDDERLFTTDGAVLIRRVLGLLIGDDPASPALKAELLDI